MSRVLILIIIATACAACQRAEQTGPAAEAPATPAAIPPISGKDAYDRACAGCHEEGKHGAPRTGDPEAWVGRSSLWEAVLIKHAQDGYLDMPAHGEDGHVSDAAVAAAAEYMLELTHPDQPHD